MPDEPTDLLIDFVTNKQSKQSYSGIQQKLSMTKNAHNNKQLWIELHSKLS